MGVQEWHSVGFVHVTSIQSFKVQIVIALYRDSNISRWPSSFERQYLCCYLTYPERTEEKCGTRNAENNQIYDCYLQLDKHISFLPDEATTIGCS